jgi:carbonic anhydrase
MTLLVPATHPSDVLSAYRDTPIASLLAYHNLRRRHRRHARAELLLALCLDQPGRLRVPDSFAFVLRTGGGNVKALDFHVSLAVALGGMRALALVGHDECGLVDLVRRRDAFVARLREHGGWLRGDAEDHFDRNAPLFEAGDVGELVLSEAARLRARYPRLLVAPLFYRIREDRLYQLVESSS